MKRRDFLKLTPAAAAAGFAVSSVRAAQPAGTARRTGSSFDPWVEIRRDHVEHNVREISRRVGGRPILAVIKNNGYGMGVDEAARVLEPLAPVAGFAVVKLQEAAALRDAGIRKPVLLMGPLDESGLEYAVAHGVDLVSRPPNPGGPRPRPSSLGRFDHQVVKGPMTRVCARGQQDTGHRSQRLGQSARRGPPCQPPWTSVPLTETSTPSMSCSSQEIENDPSPMGEARTRVQRGRSMFPGST